MIDGVTILTSEIVMTSCTGINIMSYIIFGLFVLGFIVFLIGAVADILGILQTGGSMLICAFILFFICLPIDATTQIPDYTKYEVILDDSVSMNEFMNTYEILEQRGQIYVVKEINE